MKYSLRMKLSISYLLLAVICVASLSILTDFFLDKQFREYVTKNQEQKNKEVITAVSQQYQSDRKWDRNLIEIIGISALENGLIIKVKDSSGNVIWDATVHNNGICRRIIEKMAYNMNRRYPNVKGGYVEKTYLITSDFDKVGSVDIGYYGPFNLSDNDLMFINTLNNLLIGVGVFSLLFALVLGSLMARRLSAPISRVINTAQMIAKGDYGGRIKENSNTKEICELTGTVNNLAQTLENQESLRKKLTADVAHELRTPLATLQSHMEAMIDGIWKPDVKRLKSCYGEIMRISRLVNDLSKLAKVEGENLVLNKTRFDISELTQHIINNFEPDFRNKGVEINLHGEKEMVCVDRDKISQVVVNLISNALKYTPRGGSVILNIKGTEDLTQIIVADTGPGISQEDIPYIFERFYRADKSRNSLTGGSGIGLAIVKAIVEAHKGKIMAFSEPGKGTEFTVILPKQSS